MQRSRNKATDPEPQEVDAASDYVLDSQIGFLLRRATQRHLAIFFEHLPDITSTQFAALAKLCEVGMISQNELGRRIAMDGATAKGVVDRLRTRGFAETNSDPADQRRLLISPTAAGYAAYRSYLKSAKTITRQTLAPLNDAEATALLSLLEKLA